MMNAVQLGLGLSQWLLLGILGAALYYVLRLMRDNRQRLEHENTPDKLPNRSQTPKSAPTTQGIQDTRRGDWLSIRRAGRDFQDLEFVVNEIHRYSWGQHHWYEIIGDSPEEGRVSLEWEEDDGLYIALAQQDGPRHLAALNITESDLQTMDETQSSQNTLRYGDVVYHYTKSHETDYYANGSDSHETFYLWSFESDDGKHFCDIEKWQGEAFSVSLSRAIPARDVTLMRA